jgi:hypothetical protein
MKKRIHKKPPRRVKSIKKSYQKIITILTTVVVTIFLASIIGAYLFVDKKEIVVDLQQEKNVLTEQNKKLITFEEKTKALEIEYAKNDNNTYIENKDQKTEQPKFHFEEPDYGEVGDIQHQQIQQPKPKKEELPKLIEKSDTITAPKQEEKVNKPKLAIIIDDVTTTTQVKRILNIGYIVNMSFLPPTDGHPNSAKIAKKLDNYMIHLPLQASSSQYEEEKTLYISDNIVTIENRIRELKKLYPKADFINNHTGSKFTANQIAMDKLFKVLKKYNYTFVDSRTTADSVATESANKYGVRMLSRNIFLDNNKNKPYIQGQLKKAIKTAKKFGTAIAIGHPYGITFKTLKESKELLEGLDLVYINQL